MPRSHPSPLTRHLSLHLYPLWILVALTAPCYYAYLSWLYTPYCSYYVVTEPLWFLTDKTEILLILAYIWPLLSYLCRCCLMLALLSYFDYYYLIMSVYYFGCRRLVMVLLALADYRIILAIIMAFIALFSANIILLRLTLAYSDYHNLVCTDYHITVIIIIGCHH